MRKCILILLTFALLIPCSAQQLKVSANKRYLETNTGQPFLWLGDTAWDLFHKLSREEAKAYLTKRAKQGFTVIQAVVLTENNGLRTPNYYGYFPLKNFSPELPDEAYFKHIDFVINEAAKLGLFIALLPTWGDKVPSNRPGSGPIIFNKENALNYGEHLGKRYRDKPIIWVLGGDRNVMNNEVKQIWQAMATGLRKGDNGKHLITYHPAGEASSSASFQDAPWLDFNMYQSGHASRYMPVYKFAAADRENHPAKPVVDAEPPYEDIPVQFWTYIDWNTSPKIPAGVLNADSIIIDKSHFKKGFFTDADVRMAAYWDLLSGACGYTYGNNAVWQMFRKGGSYAVPCLTDYKEALNVPGATHIRYVKQLFSQYPFNKLIPDQQLIVGNNPTDSTHIRAAIADDGSFALIYLGLGQPVQLNAVKLKASQSASWYNPRDGKKAKATMRAGYKYIPPTSGRGNDWVLILENKQHQRTSNR